MNKFNLSFLFYVLISIYSFDNVYALTSGDEKEIAEENVNILLSFFSAEVFLNIIFAIISIVLIFFITKVLNSKLTGYLEGMYSWEGSGWEEIIWVVTRTINVSMLIIWSSITLSILWIDMWIFMWWIWFWLGFTLKTFLTNFVAWITMVTQWFYHNWDIIEIWWKMWKIIKIHALFTVIEQFDWVMFFIPNTKFMEENVSNYYLNDKRRIDIEISVDYNTDITKAKKIIIKVLESYPWILSTPDFDIIVDKLGDCWILLNVRFWINSKDNYFQIKSNVIETINLLFKQSNIIIPFPQITISNRENK